MPCAKSDWHPQPFTTTMPPRKASAAVREVDTMAWQAIAEAVSKNPNAKTNKRKKKTGTSAAEESTIMTTTTTNTAINDSDPETRLSIDETSDLSDLDDAESSAPKRTRTTSEPILSPATPSEDDAEPEATASEITYYVNILKPQAAPGRGCPPRAPKEEYEQRALFSLLETARYSAILVEIARVLKISVNAVFAIGDRISWSKQSSTSSKMLLGGDVGYCALVKEVTKARAGSFMVMLFMLPPQIVVGVTELMDMMDNRNEAFNTTSTSIVQQQATFDQQISAEMINLESLYPVGNHPSFPGKRIFKHPDTGFLYKLNHLNMSSWCNHIVKGTATDKKPPSVAHFDAVNRIKNIPPPPPPLSAAAPPSVTPPSVTPPSVTPPSVTPPATATPTSALGFGSVSITDLLALGMLQQMMSNGHPLTNSLPSLGLAIPAHHHATYGPPTTALTPSAAANSLPPSPNNGLKVDVLLDAFCKQYRLDDTIKSKLETLGYVPGDRNLLKLSEDEWHGKAGFATLTWGRVKDIHKRFMEDAVRGKWADYAITEDSDLS
ncbi:hypothetical protein K435DRAFT_801580 [Dendrothele bispora CBS 962.96]|uniref:Uncharacterized protein n=1 Tax=Dendrothele bispora (strain CBS 962.96) TaxID=1314807 RepID=A0A4S8LNZ4_DENBC|nr:hypothetical protein K435DRAFT_801580 [Dendrothele bispora CBS 962.96]